MKLIFRFYSDFSKGRKNSLAQNLLPILHQQICWQIKTGVENILNTIDEKQVDPLPLL
jgi:hypothetical protein